MIRFIVQKVVDRALLKKQQLPIQAVAYFVTSTQSSKTILLYEHYTIDGGRDRGFAHEVAQLFSV